jgi:hypothetical protein
MKRATFILVAVAQVLAAACRGGSSTDFFDAVRVGDTKKVKALLQADLKLAEVFRDSARRKLTAQQLEKAEARIAAVLASRPKAGETPGSPDADR